MDGGGFGTLRASSSRSSAMLTAVGHSLGACENVREMSGYKNGLKFWPEKLSGLICMVVRSYTARPRGGAASESVRRIFVMADSVVSIADTAVCI